MSITHVGSVVQGSAGGWPVKNTTGATALTAVSYQTVDGESVVDQLNAANVWTRRVLHDEGGYRCAIWDCLAPVEVGAGHEIRVTSPGTFTGFLDFMAFSAPGPLEFVGANSAYDGTYAGTSCQPGAPSPAVSEDDGLYVTGAILGSGGTSAHAINSGFTVGATGAYNVSGYLNQAAAGAVNPTLSWTGSSRWVTAIAAYQPAAGTTHDTTLTEAATAAEATTSIIGTLADIAEAATATDVCSATVTAAASGTLTTEPLVRNNSTVAASSALNYLALYDQTTGALVLRVTGLSTNGAGVATVTDAAIVAGTTYRVDWEEASGQRRMPLKAAT